MEAASDDDYVVHSTRLAVTQATASRKNLARRKTEMRWFCDADCPPAFSPITPGPCSLIFTKTFIKTQSDFIVLASSENPHRAWVDHKFRRTFTFRLKANKRINRYIAVYISNITQTPERPFTGAECRKFDWAPSYSILMHLNKALEPL